MSEKSVMLEVKEQYTLERYDTDKSIFLFFKEYTYLPYGNYVLYELIISKESPEASFVVVGQGWGPPHWCSVHINLTKRNHKKILQLAENIKTLKDFDEAVKTAKTLAKKWYYMYKSVSYCPYFDD